MTVLHGKERPFIVGLLLSVVTFGIYPLYWHYRVHAELAGQLGRENKAKGIWIANIVVVILQWVLAVVFVFMLVAFIVDRVAEDPDYEPTNEEIFDFVFGLAGFLAAFIILSLVGLVLFVIYVAKQYDQLKDATRRMSMGLRGGGAGAFFGLYFGGMVAGMIVPLVGWIAQLIMVPWAYYFLQESYNDVWRGLRQGQRLPTDAEWAAGPQMPAGPGMAPSSAGFGTPPPSYGAPSSSWDASPRAGPVEYAPPAPPGLPPSPIGAGGSYTRHRTGPGAEVRQTFECPRCRAHIPAAGLAGARVEIRCSACGETGQVTLPMA